MNLPQFLFYVSCVFGFLLSDATCDGPDSCETTIQMRNHGMDALIQCSFLPDDFIRCDPPLDLTANASLKGEDNFGCTKFGGENYDQVEKTSVHCHALPCIECSGPRDFIRTGRPCIKYTGHYFLSTLLYSLLLGFLGVDRFCLGYTGVAVGKLMTLGGFGVWWIVDVILLVTGAIRPVDDSNWMPYY